MSDEDKKPEPATPSAEAEAEASKETKEEKVTPAEEKKEEAAPAKDEKEEPAADAGVEVPAKFKKIVEEIEKMPVLELNELVKVFEKKFGVSAQAVAVAAPGAGGGEGGDEEQDSFTVELKSVGDQKIAIIKAVKEILGLGLKDAKDLVDAAPSVLKEGVKKEEAEEMKKKIEDGGGTVELK